jgi:hypothetical protein
MQDMENVLAEGTCAVSSAQQGEQVPKTRRLLGSQSLNVVVLVV